VLEDVEDVEENAQSFGGMIGGEDVGSTANSGYQLVARKGSPQHFEKLGAEEQRQKNSTNQVSRKSGIGRGVLE
jgi:hypothetical protein